MLCAECKLKHTIFIKDTRAHRSLNLTIILIHSVELLAGEWFNWKRTRWDSWKITVSQCAALGLSMGGSRSIFNLFCVPCVIHDESDFDIEPTEGVHGGLPWSWIVFQLCALNFFSASFNEASSEPTHKSVAGKIQVQSLIVWRWKSEKRANEHRGKSLTLPSHTTHIRLREALA